MNMDSSDAVDSLHYYKWTHSSSVTTQLLLSTTLMY